MKPYRPVKPATNETRNFHPTDQALRKAGFVIHARPRVGLAIWMLPKSSCDDEDQFFTEDEAMDWARAVGVL